MIKSDQSLISLGQLPKIASRSKKRLGRGYGSGKGGHTSSRGQKGQRSRRTIPWSFEGGALPLSRRLPFWRGKGQLNPLKPKPVVINLWQLDRFKAGAKVDIQTLIKEKVVREKEFLDRGVKILGRGKITKKLTMVGLSVSAPARAKIEKAGGKVEQMAEMVKMAKTVKIVEDKTTVEKKAVKKVVQKKAAVKPKKVAVKIKRTVKKV